MRINCSQCFKYKLGSKAFETKYKFFIMRLFDYAGICSNNGRRVVRAPDSWSKGRGFESLQEQRENVLLQGQLSVLTLISVSVPPPCYRSST